MIETEAIEFIIKTANEKIEHHTAELKRWGEIKRLAIELDKHYNLRQHTEQRKPKTKTVKKKYLKKEKPEIKSNGKPTILFYAEAVLKEKKTSISTAELQEAIKQKFDKVYKNETSFSNMFITYLKNDKSSNIEKHKIGKVNYFNLKGIPFDAVNIGSEPGYCNKCNQHFGNLAKHNEIRHSKPELNEKSLQKEIIPSSMRN